MTIEPLRDRGAVLASLVDEDWDVVIVGGGIVGSGALLDATSRGLNAVLIEKDDLAVGTSSRSSRLIHGGLRYLEDLRLPLVREALAERSRLLRLAPHLVRLQQFLLPIYGWPLVHRAVMGAGLVLYDVLGASRDGGRAHHLGAGAVADLIPDIRRAGLRGGATYHDAIEDDARYCIAVARTAIEHGATVVTRAHARELLMRDGSVTGVRVSDAISGEELEVRARSVIDATGVWQGSAATRLGGSDVSLVPSRGTHLVLERDRLPLQVGMTLRIPGRVLFLMPHPGTWIIGTTDEPDEGGPDRPSPTAREVDHILENVNAVLDVDLTRDDLVGAYAGLRPLVGVPGGDTARVSREHVVHREDSGVVRVSGGKYTTYRIMARDAVDVALEEVHPRPPSRTDELQLIGAAPRDRLDALVGELATHPALDARRARVLVDRHGTGARDIVQLGESMDLLRPLAPDVDQLEVEVTWSVREELALGLDDVLSRRMRLSMARRDRGAGMASRVAELMAAELGWSRDRQSVEVDRYLVTARREYDVPRSAGHDDQEV